MVEVIERSQEDNKEYLVAVQHEVADIFLLSNFHKIDSASYS